MMVVDTSLVDACKMIVMMMMMIAMAMKKIQK